MTPAQAAAIWPVMKAFSEGKKVQFFSNISQEWRTDDRPTFNTELKWRIKPELFEGKFVFYSDGTIYPATMVNTPLAQCEIARGARIVTLREVEDKP